LRTITLRAPAGEVTCVSSTGSAHWREAALAQARRLVSNGEAIPAEFRCAVEDKNNKTAAQADAKSRKTREDFKCDF
jgi:hypothetical protein